MASADSRYRVNRAEIAAKLIDDEAILINLSTGTYYSLAGTGALVWALLEHHDAGEISAVLARSAASDERSTWADVEPLLDELVAERLIVPADGDPPGPLPETGLPVITAYEPPVLEKYSDMSDLLALDPPMPGLTDIPWQPPSD